MKKKQPSSAEKIFIIGMVIAGVNMIFRGINADYLINLGSLYIVTEASKKVMIFFGVIFTLTPIILFVCRKVDEKNENDDKKE